MLICYPAVLFLAAASNLGHENFTVREQASAILQRTKGLGKLLAHAMKSSDPEV